MTAKTTNQTTLAETDEAKVRPKPGSAYAQHQAKMQDQAKRIAGIPVQPRQPAPVEDAEGNPLRLGCARTNCQTSHDISQYKTDEDRKRFADASGYVDVVDASGKKHLFCSRRCVTLQMASPDSAAGAVAFAPKVLPSVAPKRLTIKNGAVHCGYAVCEAKFQVDGADESRLLRTAEANGWQQTKDGVFCGGNCAKRARADIAAGIHPAGTYVPLQHP
jgi:hypothetical protein